MIKVEKLTKIYQSNNNMQVKALDNVSFVLPDTGLVFVIGKSGSGKSTLLNMLGGLDGMTSGDIIADGNRFSQFSNKDYDSYRNSRIGFVFQDFHLIDSLNVYDNVALSFDLQAKEDKQAVLDAIEKVGLKGYEKRFPQQLSGGQKQRIAIARALVKKPNIILADEPTGNLDSKTSKQILDLLKQVSSNCLVVTVSHNLPDAYKYADRIIELEDGKIIKDVQKTQEFCDEVVITEKTIKIPQREILPKEKTAINAALKNGGITRFEQAGTEYEPAVQPEYQDKKVELKSSKLKFKKGVGLMAKMSRKTLLFSVFYSIMTACVIIILATSQILVAFNANKIVQREIASNNSPALVMRKNWPDYISDHNLNMSYMVELTDKDRQAFESAGAGKYYELTNYVIAFGSSNFSMRETILSGNSLSKSPYVTSLGGTLITDEEFLREKFGKDGKVSYVCKSNDLKPGGIYITDYFADCFFAYRLVPEDKRDYSTLLGEFNYSQTLIKERGYAVGYINGIIDTDYETKYADLLQMYKDGVPAKEISKTPIFSQAADEIVQYLAIGYTTNQNFFTAIKDSSFMEIAKLKEKTYIENDITRSANYNLFAKKDADIVPFDLVGNQVTMHYSTYNHLFKTSYTASNYNTDFVPHQVKLYSYDYVDTNRTQEPIVYTLDIVGLISESVKSSYAIYTSDEMLNRAKDDIYMKTSLYFDDVTKTEQIFEVAEQNNFIADSIVVSSVQSMAKYVSVFSDLFNLISFVLYIAAVFLVIYFGLKTVNKRMYEIGIIRGLGGKNRSLAWMFALQIVITAIVTCVLSYVGLYVFVNLADEVLVRALMVASSGYTMMDIELISFNVPIIMADCGGVMLISLLSTLLPLLTLRKVKPINIIKAKEL